MRYIKLTDPERETIENGYKNHPKFHVRQRCHALLLSDQGWNVKSIALLFKVRTRTIYTWMDRWLDMGIVGVMILRGRGRKASLSADDKGLIEMIKKKS